MPHRQSRKQTFEDIKVVYSHPQALAQCRSYLEKHNWEIVPAYDTAGSVKLIKEKGLRNAAAIASEKAADLNGMKILARNIADNLSELHTFPCAFSRRCTANRRRQNLNHILRQT